MPRAKPSPKRAAKPPVKRSIGRPAANGNSVGREKLLKTACDLLKTTPPSRLTRLMVAQKANVDPSLIRYYFRDRISLLAAAAERLADQYAGKPAAASDDSAATGLERLEARLGANFHLDAGHANSRRLLLDELMISGAPQARAAANKITARGADVYRSIVEAGVADGTLRGDDPILLHIAVTALSSYFPLAKTVYEMATGERISQQAMTEKYRAFMTGLVLHGMAPAGAPAPKAPRRPRKVVSA